MRQRIFHVGLVLVTLVVGVGAYAITRTLESGQSSCTGRFLGLSRGQCEKIRSEDPGFAEQTQELSQTLDAQRAALVALIADPQSDANAIRAAARKVTDTHHALMRRVVQHLLVVRRHTDPRQCMRLTGLCSGVIGSGAGRGGQGQGMGPGRGGQGQGMGPGRGGQGQGMGPGRGGMGMGRGMRYRYGQLGPALGLTDEQRSAGAEKDPTFETDSVQLAQQICDAHGRLAQALEDANTPDADAQQALAKLIALRVQLEQRTVDYVLSIRPLLSTEQQQRLIGLSRGGRRGRGGQGWGASGGQ